MLSSWFDLPLGPLFAVVATPYALAALIIYWASQCRPFRTKVQMLTGVVAPFFGSVGLLFGLLTGFLAADISDRNRQAARALLAEADGLHTVQTLSLASITDMSAIRDALHAYAESVLKDEWPHMVDEGRSIKTELAFTNLLKQVSDPSIARSAGQAVHTALLNGVARTGSARTDRLALSDDRTNQYKWLTVILLGIITQVAIGLVHLDKPRAQIASLAVFSFAVIVTLTLLAAQEHPFAGVVQVPATAIQNFLDSISVKT